MVELNLPPAALKLRCRSGKDYVFDSLRRRFVRLTPEEYVRQRFIEYLATHLNYPRQRLANEVCIELGGMVKRCDTVLYDEQLRPLMIIEYKAPTVEIDQAVFDQIARYNMTLRVPWLVVSNGLAHYCCRIDFENGSYSFMPDIPDMSELRG
jgi:hypothetical protein